MKKIILILIAMVMLYGCVEKSKIELVPDIDKIYKSVNLVPKIAKPINEPLTLPFEEAIKEIHKKENPNEDVIYPIYVRLYISEKGEIDKIKVLRHNLYARNRKSTNPKYDERIYLYPEKIITNALPELQKVKFTPAESEGKKIKMRADVNVIYSVNKNGYFRIDKEKMKREHAKSDFDNPVQGIFFVVVEEMPEPIGGIKAIQKNIVYPEIAKRTGIEGRVYVKAYVDSTGKVVKTEILRGIGGGCDEAAEEAVKKVEFIPGKQRGKRMNVQVTVPILFKLNGDGEGTKKSVLEDKLINKRIIPLEQNGLSKLSGKVVDVKTGMPIVATNIILDGTKLGAATDNNGVFYISKVPSGNYKVIVKNSTYGKHYMGTISLSKDKNTVVELRIKKLTNLYQ